MWLLLTRDGGIVSENDVMWPDLPPEIEIETLLHGSGKLTGFESYGFQRFAINVPAGRVGGGVQLIGVIGDEATIVETNEVTGERRRWTIPKSQLTYAPELLRHGTR